MIVGSRAGSRLTRRSGIRRVVEIVGEDPRGGRRSVVVERRRSPRRRRWRAAPRARRPWSTSSTTPGPRACLGRRPAAIARRARLWRRSASSCGKLGPIQSTMRAQRYWLEIHEPSGRVRAIKPCVDIRNSRRVDTPIVPSYRLPTATLNCSARSGIELRQLVRRAAVRARPAPPSSRPRAGRSRRRHPGRRPASRSIASNLRRSPGTRAFVHEACRTAARSSGTTNIVRRMANIRSSARRS